MNLYRGATAEVVFPPLLAPPEGEVTGERHSLRRQLETPERAVVIVQVGRMEAGKGQAEHLRALGKLKELPGWVCWQVGGAQQPQEIEYVWKLKRLAAESGIAGRVRFLGQRSDVGRLLAAADIYCQPNTEPEGFGLSFVEALRAGLPVVTAALGGATEIVNSSCGVLVPAGDTTALAEALRPLILNHTLREELGAAGPARARELCDAETQLWRINDVLRGVVNRKREEQ
jgi:glycosyltransferase involved in cell wall biosynthesis